MSTELSNALLSVLQRASETQVEGPSAKRSRRMKGCSDAVVVLADVSGSMGDPIGSSGLSKHEHLKIALLDVLKYHPKVAVFAFADSVRLLNNINDLPGPGSQLGSGTDLARALRGLKKLNPRKTIIISDGLPNDEFGAVAAADEITGQIDTIYCGPDSHPAVLFLQRLAHDAAGEAVVWDGYRDGIAPAIRALIG